MITSPTGDFSMDGYLKSNLDVAKRVIYDDWDMIILVDGTERGGKSVMAMQMAYYCDPTLSLDRVCLTAADFKKAVINAKPYTAVIYDEAFTGLSSRNTMTKINKSLVEMLAEIGQKNLFIFIVCPTFFDLDKYPALWRSRALVHIYTGKEFKRGFFRFYASDTKKKLYVFGKKTYDYDCVMSDFYGCFTNHYVLDKAAYKKKKADSLKLKETKKTDDNSKDHKIWLFNRLQAPEFEHLKDLDKAAMLEIHPRTFRYWKTQLKEQKEHFSLENEGFEAAESGN